MKKIISLFLLGAMAGPSWGMETVVGGVRYDCTGSGTNAKAAVLAAKATDTPYSGEIEIPATVDYNQRSYRVVEVKKEAFANCAGLVSVSLPDGVENMGMSAFEGSADLVSANIPAGLYSLPQYMFKDCTSLASIVIPDNIGMSYGNVFEGCSALVDVTLSQTCYLLGANMFKDCISLRHIVIPASVTMTGVNLFAGCTSLEWVEFAGATPPSVSNSFDERFLAEGVIYVPDEAVEAYKAVAGLAGAASIRPVSERPDTPGPQPEWESRGQATFIDPWICSVFDAGRYSWLVEVEESTTRPGYFRLKNPYLNGNSPLFQAPTTVGNDIYINACDPEGVYIESQGLGFTPNSSVAPEFLISSVAGRHQENGVQSLEDDKAQGLTGFFHEGVIKIPKEGLLWSFPPYTDEDYYWTKYDFELRFPGAVFYEIETEVMCIDDYYVNLWKECVRHGDFVPVNVMPSDAVKSVKYGVLPGVSTPTAAQLHAIATGDALAAKGRNDFSVPADYVGRMSMIFVALDDMGNVRATSKVLFDVIDDELYGPWKSLGTTQYDDVIISSIFEGMYTSPYQVEVEESTSRPGIYRLKNVYASCGHWSSGEGNIHHHEDENHYLYINAENPDGVYVMPSPVGFKGNDGSMLLTSPVAVNIGAGYTVDEQMAVAPQLFGSLRDRVITIPTNAIYGSETRYQDGEYYPANTMFDFRVTVPEPAGVDAAVADSHAPARYFNLQGIEVKNPRRGEPVIRLKDGCALKLVQP